MVWHYNYSHYSEIVKNEKREASANRASEAHKNQTRPIPTYSKKNFLKSIHPFWKRFSGNKHTHKQTNRQTDNVFEFYLMGIDKTVYKNFVSHTFVPKIITKNENVWSTFFYIFIVNHEYMKIIGVDFAWDRGEDK